MTDQEQRKANITFIKTVAVTLIILGIILWRINTVK